MRSSVIYPYVSFDCLCSLKDNLLSTWCTSTLPSRIVQRTPHPIEALGISPALLAKKVKLCSSDWLKCGNRPKFPSLFGGDLTAPSLPSNPNWIEELKLTLFESQHFALYQTPNTSAARIHIQYEEENLLEEYEDFKNQDSEHGEDVIMGDAHKEEEMDETEKALKQTEFEMKA
ncbi:hypothetical protein CsSME_00032431 [Camellia sinensis var. sinensis]